MSYESEKRSTLSKMELRTSSDGYPEISGLAAAYNTVSSDLGGFVETIAPGAFRKVLASKPDVRMLINHDPNLILGRTKSGTLTLWEDAEGLHFRCKLPATKIAEDFRENIKRGDIDACSFAFVCGGQDSFSDFAGKRLRIVHGFSRLDDVSAVTYPAYPEGTSVSARSKQAAHYRPSDRRVVRDPEHQAMLDRAKARLNRVRLEEMVEDANLRARARVRGEQIAAQDDRIRSRRIDQMMIEEVRPKGK